MACSANILGFEIGRDERVVGDGALAPLGHFVEQYADVGERVGLEELEGDGVVGEEAEAEEEHVEGGEERQRGGGTEEGEE